MKKNLLVLFILLAGMSSLQSQITLDLSNMKFADLGPDTIAIFDSIAKPIIAPNANWNYSSFTPKFYTFYDDLDFTDPLFPNGQYDQFVTTTVSGALSYAQFNVYGTEASGWHQYGFYMPKQAFPLGASTGNPLDSLIFLAQVSVFTSPHTVIKFPATFGSQWSSSTNYTTNFNIGVSLLGIPDKTPGERRTKLSRVDTVNGWGKLKVHNPIPGTNLDQPVLSVKSKIVFADSFYLAGSVAPLALTQAFGLSQGQRRYTITQSFYRPNEKSALLTVFYADTLWGFATRFISHIERLDKTTGTENTPVIAGFQLYPNPMHAGSEIHLDFQSIQGGEMIATMHDMKGTNIYQSAVTAGSNTLTLPDALDPGVYFVSLIQNGETLATRPLLIQ